MVLAFVPTAEATLTALTTNPMLSTVATPTRPNAFVLLRNIVFPSLPSFKMISNNTKSLVLSCERRVKVRWKRLFSIPNESEPTPCPPLPLYWHHLSP